MLTFKTHFLRKVLLIINDVKAAQELKAMCNHRPEESRA